MVVIAREVEQQSPGVSVIPHAPRRVLFEPIKMSSGPAEAQAKIFSGAPLWRTELPSQKAVDLANAHLENAKWSSDSELVLLLCDEVMTALFRMENPTLNDLICPDCITEPSLQKDTATIFSKHGDLLVTLGRGDKAETSYEIAEKLKRGALQSSTAETENQAAADTTAQ
ncbi:hypothetical protein BGZ65_005888 [Modicella reniformis]|uniref:Uncharacterized protein n=1 Tax=Modicella reniformis TaxID=1440133 RepID=A0A9P6IX08_9FUNG|nr:hypothetical protein BGZ65_005888 [Modicella reniformis]